MSRSRKEPRHLSCKLQLRIISGRPRELVRVDEVFIEYDRFDGEKWPESTSCARISVTSSDLVLAPFVAQLLVKFSVKFQVILKTKQSSLRANDDRIFLQKQTVASNKINRSFFAEQNDERYFSTKLLWRNERIAKFSDSKRLNLFDCLPSNLRFCDNVT